ncbi:MAG: polyprenyl synthetase family protein [Thermoplasmata archaeon]|nr:MAG: polyprenyl synthetase family protein [Thermoplasmata archaeon]
MEFLEGLKDRIELINSELARYLNVGDQPRLKSAMRHLPLVESSKRLRPLLALLCAEAVSDGPGGEGSKRTIPFALTLEVIHNFTLVHDDIMDEDELRRGVKTVHVEYDMPTAINAGDALFARAFEILSETGLDDAGLRKLTREVAQMVREVGEGQQWDLDFGSRMDVSTDDFLKMIELKTARIFQLAAKGGTLIGGGTEDQVKSMEEYGRLIGVGFQILDDILDFSRDSALKCAGSDIRQGKRTLLVLHALEKLKDDEKTRTELMSILGNSSASDEDIKRSLEILNSCGSMEYAQDFALNYGKLALKKLEVLPESPSRKALEGFANFMVEGRTF